MGTNEPDHDNQMPAPADAGSLDNTPGQKRRAADLMAGTGKEMLGEFGHLDITGFGAVSDAARAVREAMGEPHPLPGSHAPVPAPEPVKHREPPPPEPEVIQPSTRLGDISSQFGKLIIDGFQAVSGAFRSGKSGQRPGEQSGNHPAPNQPAVAPPDIEQRSTGLSDRFSKLIMDKFRAIVDSRWQEHIKAERDALLKATDKIPDTIVKEEIQRNMTAFERRIQSLKLDTAQVRNTYRSLLFLIEDPRKQSCLNETERLLLALQVMRLSAFPEQVTTGRFATGDIAQIEKKLYEECPSAAAHLITEIALYSEFMSQRGLHVSLPGEELHPDRESHDPIGNNGANRSYASQLFQQVSLNLYYSRHGIAGMKAHYRINPANDCEELITLDGRNIPVDASARSISIEELCAEIAGEPGSRR